MFGTHDTVAIVKTEPVVVEVSADVAFHAGRFRHPLRVVRVRPDLLPADIDRL